MKTACYTCLIFSAAFLALTVPQHAGANDKMLTNGSLVPVAENIKRYHGWAGGMPDPRAAKALELMAGAMESEQLPTEFLEWNILKEPREYIVQAMLALDPKTITVHDALKDGCLAAPNQTDSRFMSMVVAHEAVNIKCPNASQFYVTSDATDIIQDAGNDDIFVTGGGSDKIVVGQGRTIVVIDKGWGKQIIDKDCVNSTLDGEDRVIRSDINEDEYVGIGISISSKDGEYIILGTAPESPARDAGIRPGDILVAVEGVPVKYAELEDISKHIRGAAGTPVTLVIRPRGTTQDVTKTIKRKSVTRSYMDGTFALNSEKLVWPYKYMNFIVFGPGIDPSDMKWDAPHNRLYNLVSGDEVKFLGRACFNFVYTEITEKQPSGPL